MFTGPTLLEQLSTTNLNTLLESKCNVGLFQTRRSRTIIMLGNTHSLIYIYLTLYSLVVSTCSNMYNFYILPTQCIYVFCMDLRTNSDYFPIQH
jgi:hypothetical protein